MGLYYEVDNHVEFNNLRAKSTLCCCDCIPCGHVWCVTRMVRFVMLRLQQGAVRWWRCLKDIFDYWTYHWYEIDVSFDHDDHFEFDYFWAKSTLCGCDCIPCGHVWFGDSTGAVHHVEIEMESSAMVELLNRYICTIERITDMKLISRSNMTIILCSTIFEPSQHSVAVTVYHVVIYV